MALPAPPGTTSLRYLLFTTYTTYNLIYSVRTPLPQDLGWDWTIFNWNFFDIYDLSVASTETAEQRTNWNFRAMLWLVERSVKVNKSRKQIMKFRILQKNKRNTLRILSVFRSFFGRIKDIIICFRDLLTFSLQFTRTNQVGWEA